ncbi:MAG: hypothetical protein ACO3D0_12425, partial [Ilumatobacteraceae bacterium]
GTVTSGFNVNGVFEVRCFRSIVTTVAGTSDYDWGSIIVDGVGPAAGLAYVPDLAIDPAGDLWALDTYDCAIKRITDLEPGSANYPFGRVETIYTSTFCPTSETADVLDARLGSAYSLTFDRAGDLYVSLNGYIIKITDPGTAEYQETIFAGSAGQFGNVDGTGEAARFGAIWDIAFGADGNLYVATWVTSTGVIRMVTPEGVVTSIAGNTTGVRTFVEEGAALEVDLHKLDGLAIDASGDIFASAGSVGRIFKISDPGEDGSMVTIVAGNSAGTTGYLDGPALEALFEYNSEPWIDGAGNLYVADGGNNRIRKITAPGTPEAMVTTIAGSGAAGVVDGLATEAQFDFPEALVGDEFGTLYTADLYPVAVLRRIG